MNLRISLASGTEEQKALRKRLRSILSKYSGLRSWQFTDYVRIDDSTISFSHPILTIGSKTRHSAGSETGLLSVYLHEQLHWFVSQHPGKLKAAMRDLTVVYPKVKVGSKEGGARDANSTYLHLLVCFLELDALSRLIGEPRARRLVLCKPYYRWIYRQVVSDNTAIGRIVIGHGLIPTVTKRQRVAGSNCP